jgi:hypothetical protein
VLSIGCWNRADCVLFFFSIPGFMVCDYPLMILGITKHVLNINNLYELKIFISFISGENHRIAASHCQTLPHNVVSSTPRHEQDSNSQLKL